MADGRPSYESSEDRANELLVIKAVLKAVRCDEAKKMPRKSHIDYALFRYGRIEFFAEVKRRKNLSTTYIDLILSLDKFKALNSSQIESSIPSLLLVGWDDYIGVLRFPVPYVDVRWDGREDRQDSQDMEPCVRLPVERFARVDWPAPKLGEDDEPD